MIWARYKRNWFWYFAFLAGGILIAVQMWITELEQMAAYNLTGIQFVEFGILGYFAGLKMKARRHGLIHLILCIIIGCAYAICFFVPLFRFSLYITPFIMFFIFGENVGFLCSKTINDQHYTNFMKKFVCEIVGIWCLVLSGMYEFSKHMPDMSFFFLCQGLFLIIYGLLFKWKRSRVCLEKWFVNGSGLSQH